MTPEHNSKNSESSPYDFSDTLRDIAQQIADGRITEGEVWPAPDSLDDEDGETWEDETEEGEQDAQQKGT